MPHFFISYTQTDRPWAEWIAWTLEAAGHTTILQAWDIEPGRNFVLEMHRAAQTADHTIAVLSPNYLEANRRSGFTAAEWAAAFKANPDGRQRKLIPVRVAECDPPGLLGPIVYIDLVGLDEAEARDRLLAGIAPGRRKPDTPPPFPPAAPAFPGQTSIQVQGSNNVTAADGSIAIGGDVHGDVTLDK